MIPIVLSLSGSCRVEEAGTIGRMPDQEAAHASGLFAFLERGGAEIGNRIACFIDGGYLDKVLLKAFNRTRIDYSKLSLWMANGDELFRTYYYHCLPYQGNPPTPEESKRYANALRFIDGLRRIDRFTVRLGKLEKISTNVYKQKQVDVLFAIDLTKLSSKGQITHAGILTSDSDFLPAIEIAKNEGIIIKLFFCDHPELRPHHELWQVCDERIPITDQVIQSILRK